MSIADAKPNLTPAQQRQLTDYQAAVQKLVQMIEQWAKARDWSTRIIERTLEESTLGKFTVPALLLQHEFIKILIEPLASDGIGVEGQVDMYRMPLYEDAARLFLANGKWRVHYIDPRSGEVDDDIFKQSNELDEKQFFAVLDVMKQHGNS